MASEYLRGNYLGVVRAPAGSSSGCGCWGFCLRAAPQPRIRHTGAPLGQSPPAESSSTYCWCSAQKGESGFLARCVVRGRNVPGTRPIHGETSEELAGATPLLSGL